MKVPLPYYLIASAILATLSVTTFTRNDLWRDELTLWKDVDSKSPNKGRVCWILANYYHKIGDDARSVEYYKGCIYHNPQALPLYLGLAQVYQDIGDALNEINVYRRALNAQVNDVIIHTQLGDALFKQLELQEALSEFTIVASQDPQNAYSYYMLGLISRARGDYRESIHLTEKAISLDPGNAHYKKALEEIIKLSTQPSV